MKKLLTLCLLLLLSGCSTLFSKEEDKPVVKDPEIKEPVKVEKISYEVKQNEHFEEGSTIDFNKLISGDFDSVEFSTADLSIGQHHVVATMKKDKQTEKTSIQYFVDAKKVVAKPQEPLKPVTPPKVEKPVTPPIKDIPKPVEPTKPVTPAKPVTPPKTEKPAKPTISYSYENSQPAVMRSDLLTLVNKEYRLDPKFVPSNMISVPIKYASRQMQVNKVFFDQFLVMREAAAKEGLTLKLNSCYRSYDTQMRLYKQYLQSYSQAKVDTFSARPGHSEHQLGLACDFANATKGLGNFTGTKEAIWMAENAHKFGFLLRYPQGKTDITGYKYESWHYRYLGVDIATKVKNSGLTYEEWYAQNLR